MRSWTGIPELKDIYRQVGAAKFCALASAIIGWIALGSWLAMTTQGWPEAYGLSCHGRGCLIQELWYSPGLLSGSWREWALFIWLWSMPALVIGAVIYAFMKKRGKFSKFEPE